MKTTVVRVTEQGPPDVMRLEQAEIGPPGTDEIQLEHTVIESLAPRGFFMSFGSTTGEAPAVKPSLLQHKGSLYFCRPTLANYVAERGDFVHSASKVFEMVQAGNLVVEIGQRRAHSEIVDIHRDFEAGNTTGSIVLIP